MASIISRHYTDDISTQQKDMMKPLQDIKLFGGRLKRFSHHSVFTKTEMAFSIYLPPQAAKQRVPVLYWLGDFEQTDQEFMQLSGAQRIAAEHGIALVAPDTCPRGANVPAAPRHTVDKAAFGSFFLSATEKPWDRHYHMYEYIVSELPTLVKASFPVDSRKQAISGIGMGGHGAMVVALRNPDRYLSVSAFAPLCSPLQSAWGRSALQHYLGNNTAAWQQNDTCHLISTCTKPVELLVDQGLADTLLLEHLKPGLLQETATRLNYPLKLRFQPGYDHSHFFVQSFIDDHITYHAMKMA